MARTDSTAVGLITDLDANVAVTSFIEAATAIVTKHCTDAAYTDADLELIERWLTAHLYSVRVMIAEMEKAGPVSEKLQSKVDLGFDTSHYGQTAMRLDWAGGLSRLNDDMKKGIKRGGVDVTWGGTEKVDIEAV